MSWREAPIMAMSGVDLDARLIVCARELAARENQPCSACSGATPPIGSKQKGAMINGTLDFEEISRMSWALR